MKKLSLLLLLFGLFLPLTVMAQKPVEPPPPPPPPPPKEERINEFYRAPPLFPGCVETDVALKIKCAEQKMLEFIYSNLKNPKKAKRRGYQGTVYVKFNIEVNGTLTNYEIVEDIGGGCGEEALRVVKLMPNWEPRFLNGRRHPEQFTLPIEFKLN